MTVTLETLRADFEVQKAELMRTYGIPYLHCWTDYTMFDHRNDQLEPDVEDFCHIRTTGFDMGEDGIDFDCKEAANLFDVATKYGLQAAMLFKLSDGQIDPRKGGDA